MTRKVGYVESQILLALVEDGGRYGCIARIAKKLGKNSSQVSLAITNIRAKYHLEKLSHRELAERLKCRI